jgi:hypothetical protein
LLSVGQSAANSLPPAFELHKEIVKDWFIRRTFEGLRGLAAMSRDCPGPRSAEGHRAADDGRIGIGVTPIGTLQVAHIPVHAMKPAMPPSHDAE